ncbi:hypothetical protein Pyn_26856 [Prunus yedoensis var. nudiflora]|uniref:Uncharacterized protein n=1 Tax=Prunus yedoensis var. nudiflora TaxID=2094558 RepID=A0A314YAL7_PRUYE|nr:hypothetical protein Pyn_26856 [Prunus yedoensis var. nudiflora]
MKNQRLKNQRMKNQRLKNQMMKKLVDDHYTQLCPYIYEVPENAIVGKSCAVTCLLYVAASLETHVVLIVA